SGGRKLGHVFLAPGPRARGGRGRGSGGGGVTGGGAAGRPAHRGWGGGGGGAVEPPSDDLAAVEGRDHLGGQPLELLEHPLGGAHGSYDELRASARDVLLEPLGQERGRAEGRAGGERPVVHAAARDERR